MDLVHLFLSYAQSHWYELIMSILAGWSVAKYVTAKTAIKEFFDFVQSVQSAKADGVLTDEEYTIIGKKAIVFSDTMWSIAKGLFTNRSKV